MRFGPEKVYTDHEDYLMSALENHYGEGALFAGEPDAVPSGAHQFVKSQYERFGIQIPRELSFLYDVGPAVACHWLSYRDPYSMYWGYSDVVFSSDWQDFAYELWEPGCPPEELDPEAVETFRYDPWQGENFFNTQLARPGLKALPDGITASVDEVHWGFLYGEERVSALCDAEYPTNKEMWLKVCRHVGCGVDFEEGSPAWPYFDLSLWAGVLWWFGPLSREFRMQNSIIHDVTIREGECLLYMGNTYAPRNYRRLPRAPESCYRCGANAWCVELTLDDYGSTRNICEGCRSTGMPRYDGATCGTKFCKYFECAHNAWHNNPAGKMGAMREHGQLAEVARKVLERQQRIQQQEKKLIVGAR